MAKKRFKIGTLLTNKRKFTNNGREVEKTLVSLALGNIRNKDPKYNMSVEIIVRDHAGKVLHKQENGFLNLIDIRAQPDELLSAGIIDQAEYEVRKERIEKLPDSVRYSLEVSSDS